MPRTPVREAIGKALDWFRENGYWRKSPEAADRAERSRESEILHVPVFYLLFQQTLPDEVLVNAHAVLAVLLGVVERLVRVAHEGGWERRPGVPGRRRCMMVMVPTRGSE